MAWNTIQFHVFPCCLHYFIPAFALSRPLDTGFGYKNSVWVCKQDWPLLAARKPGKVEMLGYQGYSLFFSLNVMFSTLILHYITGCDKNFFLSYANVLSPIFWHMLNVLDNLIRSTPLIY